jgi:predicted SPOUT superfamily RNA methylase MTH1
MVLIRNELDVHRKFMKPLKTKPFISIAIPTSISLDSKTLREQTIKISYIGRAAAIFRVENIMVYNDGEGDEKLVEAILKYMEVPPYLKKFLVPLLPELRFVGIIPPLKTPHHVELEIFDTTYREGVVLDRSEDRCIVEIGLGKKGVVYGRCPPKGSRVTVKIVRETSSYFHVVIVEKSEVDIYWGYSVQLYESLKKLLENAKDSHYLVLVATKKGVPVHSVEEELAREFMKREKILIVFGGPKLDVDEVAQREGFDINSYTNFSVNFIPRQGTVNVRTEEAVIAVLAIINYIKEKHLGLP